MGVMGWENYPDSKVHGANMGPTWVLSAPDGPHIGPMNLAIRVPPSRRAQINTYDTMPIGRIYSIIASHFTQMNSTRTAIDEGAKPDLTEPPISILVMPASLTNVNRYIIKIALMHNKKNPVINICYSFCTRITVLT